MNILLLYNGYPRLSQSYQYDEAIELNKKHNLKIFSWAWTVFVAETNVPECLSQHPLQSLSIIEQFKPDIIHGHFLNNCELFRDIAKKLNIKFTIRTHSFDILGEKNLSKYKDCINSEYCAGILAFPPFKQILVDAGYNPNKVFCTYPSINIRQFQSVDIYTQNGNDIMSGGAMLPKKNIEGFILLAKKIKQKYPEKNINYYGMEEDDKYYQSLLSLNLCNGSPVNFICVPHDQMPYEYKKHQWLIYGCCTKLKTVGYPLMIAEAQATGVGVIMYKLRDDMAEYVGNSGYLYTDENDIIDLLGTEFSQDKKINAFELSSRYDISVNIKQLENIWNVK
jgi:glycosyltransferase involved in cell wall biosynthesis